MRVVIHLPEEIALRGETSGLDREAVRSAVLAGVRRATAGIDSAETLRGAGAAGSGPGEGPERGPEVFDPTRHRAGSDAYGVASYDSAGALVNVPLEVERGVARAWGGFKPSPSAGAAPPLPLRLGGGPPPFAGRVLLRLPEGPEGGTRPVRVAADGHVAAGSLAQALGWGHTLFGGGSFAVVEGPVGAAERQVWAAATEPAVSSARLTGDPGAGADPGSWHRVLTDDRGAEYHLRTLVTAEGHAAFPPGGGELESYREELRGASPEAGRPAPGAARDFVLGPVDTALAAGRTAEATRALLGLGGHSFALASPSTRAGYLGLLTASPPSPDRRRAVLELLRSITDSGELAETLDRLEAAGEWPRLAEELDPSLWRLLLAHGGEADEFATALGPKRPDGQLGRLLREAGLAPDPAPPHSPASIHPPALPDSLLAELLKGAAALAARPDADPERLDPFLPPPALGASRVRSLARLAGLAVLSRGSGPTGPGAAAHLAGLLDAPPPRAAAALRGAEALRLDERNRQRLGWLWLWEVAGRTAGDPVVERLLAEAGSGAGRLARLAAELGQPPSSPAEQKIDTRRLEAAGLSPEKASALLESVSPAARPAFLRVVGRIDPAFLAADPAWGERTLAALAAEPRLARAVEEEGYLTVRALLRRSRGARETAVRRLAALHRLRDSLPESERRTAYPALLARVQTGDPEVWRRLEEDGSARAGQGGLSG